MTERLNSSTDEWEYEYDNNEEEVRYVVVSGVEGPSPDAKGRSFSLTWT